MCKIVCSGKTILNDIPIPVARELLVLNAPKKLGDCTPYLQYNEPEIKALESAQAL